MARDRRASLKALQQDTEGAGNPRPRLSEPGRGVGRFVNLYNEHEPEKLRSLETRIFAGKRTQSCGKAKTSRIH